MKKVMMYSSVHIWKDARIFFKEAQSLSKEYQVDFYAIGCPGEADKYETENLKIHLLPKRSRSKRYKNWIILLKEIKKSKASIYHYHDPELLLLLPFLRKKRKDNIFIYDMHENFPKSLVSKNWIPKFFKKILMTIVIPLERVLIKKNKGLIFAERSYKEDYKSILPHLNTCEIYNYPHYRPPNLTINKEVKKEEIRFVYIGRIAVVRGIWEMLSAINKVTKNSSKKIKFRLIGQCEEELLEDIQYYINKHHLEDVVEYSAFIEYDKIWNIYQESDIGFCLLHPIPNYMESIATKMFEYMASGIPMIISDFPLWNSILKESKNGIAVDPFDELQLEEAMSKLIENSELRKKYGINGRREYEIKFNWFNEEKKLTKFYNQLIETDV
ncbi:glycosyltransferase [Enterococcus mundtii]|uniref:glycosyltransferase n=1 Tax=Enterococcus TaxID=1350 RepID=UPI0032DEDF7A